MKPKYVERDVVLVEDPRFPGEWTVQMMGDDPQDGPYYRLCRMEDGTYTSVPLSEEHKIVAVRTEGKWERQQSPRHPPPTQY